VRILDLISHQEVEVVDPSFFELETELFSTAIFNVSGAHYQFRIGDAVMAGLSLEKPVEETIELLAVELLEWKVQ
jgi:hypothetical protein